VTWRAPSRLPKPECPQIEREIGYAQGFKAARLEMTADLEDLERKFDPETGSLRAMMARLRAECLDGMNEWADALSERILPLVRPEHRDEVRRLLRVPDGRA
jgi:hypothetical protein